MLKNDADGHLVMQTMQAVMRMIEVSQNTDEKHNLNLLIRHEYDEQDNLILIPSDNAHIPKTSFKTLEQLRRGESVTAAAIIAEWKAFNA